MQTSRWTGRRAGKRLVKKVASGTQKPTTRATTSILAKRQTIPLVTLEQRLIELQSLVLGRLKGRDHEAEEKPGCGGRG
jgi:hypothetical protein